MINMNRELKKLGVDVNNTSAKGITFVISDIETIKVETPLRYKISEENLTLLYLKIESLGFCGKSTIKALVGAIKESPQEVIDNFRFNYWSKQEDTASNIIKYFVDYFYTIAEKHSVYFKRGSLNIKMMRNLWFSFGGYRGLKALFKECIVETNNEFLRISALEEKFREAAENTSNELLLPALMRRPELKPQKVYTEDITKNPCITCKHCRVDRNGFRHCNRYLLPVSGYLTANEIAKLYPAGSIKLKGSTLMSDVIAEPVKKCDHKKSRIPITTYGHVAIKNRQKVDAERRRRYLAEIKKFLTEDNTTAETTTNTDNEE